jgi:multiple sugar transport system substrate-binding protein
MSRFKRVAGVQIRSMVGWLGFALGAAGCLIALVAVARPGPIIFLSTQLRPIAEAQRMRNRILADFPREVDFIAEPPRNFAERIDTEQHGGRHMIDVVGALHGELVPLVRSGALVPLDGLASGMARRRIPDSLMTLGRVDTVHQFYIPWMQASYIMVANRRALTYLPRGARIDALDYDQLAAWARSLQQHTGRRLLGFPAGPQGLMYRFLEGFLYPSYTGGIVVPFRSPAAEAMWRWFAALWTSVNPDSTGYDFMAQPLLSGDVWIAWDHIARVLGALRRRPDEFVAFPAPSGPKGLGYMPVLAGLAVPRGAPDQEGAAALIDYLTRPQTQIVEAQTVGFLPVVQSTSPPALDPGVEMAAAAVDAMASAANVLPALPPMGLGERAGEFDQAFMNTFRRIVLRGEPTRMVLDSEAETLDRLLRETDAPCWPLDPPGPGPCQAR